MLSQPPLAFPLSTTSPSMVDFASCLGMPSFPNSSLRSWCCSSSSFLESGSVVLDLAKESSCWRTLNKGFDVKHQKYGEGPLKMIFQDGRSMSSLTTS